jgi:hypothetical protein
MGITERRRLDGRRVALGTVRGVYVAAPYVDAPIVQMVHERLLAIGLRPTSSWAEEAEGAEVFAGYSPDQLRAVAEANDTECVTRYDAGVARRVFDDAKRLQIGGAST